MLSSISWASYLTAIVIALIIYYLLIVYRYYRHDLLVLTANSSQPKTVSITQFQAKDESAVSAEQPGVQSFADEIKAYLQEAANDQFEKHTIVYGLSCIANKYAALKTSEYRYAIRELIASETENYCSFVLNDEEMNKVWSIGGKAEQV